MIRIALPLLGLAVLVSHSVLPARAVEVDKAYLVQDGKIDRQTFRGYLYYGEACMRCHGPDGAGSSYAPSLVDSLKTLTKDQFVETVINGKKEVNTATQRVMPALGVNEDVVTNLDNIYGYLKARSDGAIGRGRPERIGE